MAGFEALEQLRKSVPKENKPTPVMKTKGPNVENIRSAFTPWEDRSGGTDFWEGMSERQALDTADSVHRGVQQGRFGVQDVQEQLNFTKPEARSFVNWSGPRSKTAEFGVPHTAGVEDMFTKLMTESGNPTESLAAITGDPEVTDLVSTVKGQEQLVDVQNIMTRGRFVEDPEMTVDFLKNFRGKNSYIGQHFFDQAGPNDSLRSIIKRITSEAERNTGRNSFGYGKMLQSRDFEGIDVGNPDKNMSLRRGDYAKDFLIGGVYDTDKVTNLTGRKSHGTYNPRFPEGGAYATDLNKFRSNVLDLPKKDILGADGDPLYRGRGSEKSLSMRIPLKRVQELSGGDALNKLLSNPVLKAAQDFGKNPGFRMAGLALGAVPILGDAADASTGTYDAVTKKGDQQVRGAGNAAAGITGLTAVAVPATAPVLAPVSVGLGVGNAAADWTKERRAKDKKYTRNTGSVDPFIHSVDKPVTIQAPSAQPVVSETQRRRNARRSTGGVKSKPGNNAGQWWNKALGALGL